MLRRQFSQLISDLRAELERSSDPAVGVSDLPTLKQTLNRVYETLYDEYDWPHLNVIPARIPLNAGQRFYDMPDDLAFDDIERVVVWWNDLPSDIDRGINFDHYAQYDSESDERNDPVRRWDVRYVSEPTPKEMIEVWPLPASTAQQYLQFQGKKKFVPLVNEADQCLLDDKVVVLFSAAELLPTKSGKVNTRLAAAQQRLLRVKGRGKAAQPRTRIGGTGFAPVKRAVIRVGG